MKISFMCTFFLLANCMVLCYLYYKPYKTYEDGNLTKIRLEDKINGNLVLRKVKNSDKLIFEGDNYRIFKGEVDNEGNFISQSEITKELDKIFVYDEENGILKIMIPDNNSTYRISYITDFADDAKRGDSLSNEVSLIEDSKLISKKVVVSHEISASAFAHIHDKPYERLKLIKTDKSGKKLAGAKFSFKKLKTEGSAEEDKGIFTSVSDSAIIIDDLTEGEYELREIEAPEGYEPNDVTYKISVVELESGFKVDLIGDYTGKATHENNTPDPNDPNSPDEFELIGKDGTPKGKVIKKTKPNGENEYVFTEDGTPLNGFKVKKKNPILPSTGVADTVWYYATGAGLILMACFVFRKRKEVGKL